MQSIIDIRSDTVSKPTENMLKAMATAKVGDDVYGEDPTVLELQEMAAKLLGKEAALFTPTGIMGNQICIMTHCEKKGSEIIVGQYDHTSWYEASASAVLSGQQVRTLTTDYGQMDLNEVEQTIRKEVQDWLPKTALICVENPYNGRAYSLEYMKKLSEIAKKYGVKVHLDGARVFNSAVALNCDVKEIVQYADSVMFCLSKCLCCPIGSIIAGTKEFIQRARKCRKILGGGMRQVGILAAAGIVGLQEVLPTLKEDHLYARRFEQEFEKMKVFEVQKFDNPTSMVFIKFKDQKTYSEMEIVPFFQSKGILIQCSVEPEIVLRIVVYHQIRENEFKRIISAFQEYIDSKNAPKK